MNLNRPEIREILAGEYALGLLNERTRRGFERRMKSDAGLRGSLRSWERRFNSVVETLEPVEAPAQLWVRIYENLPKKRIVDGVGQPASLWDSLKLWRNLAVLGSALAILLLAYVGFGPGFQKVGMPTQVAMVSDPQSATTAWMVTLMPDKKMIKVTAMATPPMEQDRSMELWMLPNGQAPVSLGVLPMKGTMMMPVEEAKMKVLLQTAGLAVSLEPKGGSPTGAPTGPVLYQASFYPL